jgi:glycosyltransferase involved in cell wall biosynthesis
MRLLFVVREWTEGGAAFLILRHLCSLRERGHDLSLLVAGPASAGMRARLPPGLRLHCLSVPRRVRWSGFAAIHRWLDGPLQAVNATRYDVVVGGSLFPDKLACAVFLRCRGRLRVMVLLDEGLLRSVWIPGTRAAMAAAIDSTDRFVAVSEALFRGLARAWPALTRSPCTVIPPPIADRRLDAAADKQPPARGPSALPTIVTVARLSWDKRIDACLAVHARLRRAGIDLHWHVLGDGPERKRLERVRTRLGLGERFHLEGFQDDPRARMRQADLMVLASVSEGCPTVVLESLAEGTPVVVTPVNGVSEWLTDGVNGHIVADAGEGLFRTLRALLTDSDALAALRRGAMRGRVPDPQAIFQDFAAALEPVPATAGSQVSILIPTRNQEALVARAVESALAQDYPDLEVVVCDDASTDRTPAVLGRFRGDRRFRYERRAANLGRVENYRQAVKHDARGDWVLMLDGDDYLIDPTFVRSAMQLLSEHAHREPVLVQAGHRVVWEAPDGEPVQGRQAVDIVPPCPGAHGWLTGADYLRMVLETDCFSHLGTLYSRSAALRRGVYRLDCSASDMDALLRLALSGSVVVMNRVVGCWVQHGGNASSRLPWSCIEENTLIFRNIAADAAAAGLIGRRAIASALTRCEARTLGHLFVCAAGHPQAGLRHVGTMLWLMLRINPRVCLDRGLLPSLVLACWRLARNALAPPRGAPP